MLWVLLLVGLAIFGIVGWWILFGLDRGQKHSENNAERILDQAFDGRPDVTFPIHLKSVKYETVIVGAKKRGYRLTHQTDNPYGAKTLIFEKV